MHHEFLIAFSLSLGKAFHLPSPQVSKDSRPWLVVYGMALPALLVVHKMNRLVGAVEQHLLLLWRQLFVGVREAKAIFICQSLKSGSLPARGRIIGTKGPIVKGFGFVWHNQVYVKLHCFSQTSTVGTGSHRIVKRKKPWLQLWNGNTAVRTGILLGEKMLRFSVSNAAGNDGHTVGSLQCSFHRSSHSLPHLIRQDNAVNHQIDGVLFLLVQLNAVF